MGIQLIGVRVSRFASAWEVVRTVELALAAVTDRTVVDPVHGPIHLAHVIGALPYYARTMGDPWSPSYPTQADAIRTCEEHAYVQVHVS